ncbi:amino acid ABC transporter substrate-binding protein [Paraneptunicella aestuarii]|uniref:substrate-binding periplasmic protein n=1 Tax=Paraneptunicella aestuarii TaxID=2831148 RepID=UPI001E2FBB53|nr:transporter substrate-binding domain-containing protein [Paraneptunicella aestuarii]UAA37886.1 amino acid ABC transporter substrate-binding protein [Paraneptunicella aestuarii]
MISFLIRFTFCLLLCPAWAWAVDHASMQQNPALKPIYERGKLRVAMYHKDTPPFYYLNDKGELDGVDVELIKGFAQHLGLEVEFDRSAKTLNDTVFMVANGQADMAICKLSITVRRAGMVLFTKPYINLKKALLVNRVLLEKQLKGRSKQETIQDLRGTLGVIGNSSYVGYARQRFKQMEIREYPSWKEVVKAVRNQEVVAAFRDEAEIKKVILDNKNDAVHLLTVVLQEDFDPKGIALPPDGYFLKSMLDFYIQSLGLELSANKVLFNYPDVIETIHRNRS